MTAFNVGDDVLIPGKVASLAPNPDLVWVTPTLSEMECIEPVYVFNRADVRPVIPEPQPINPADLKPGDRARCVDTFKSREFIATYEGAVQSVGADQVMLSTPAADRESFDFTLDRATREWFVWPRPAPVEPEYIVGEWYLDSFNDDGRPFQYSPDTPSRQWWTGFEWFSYDVPVRPLRRMVPEQVTE